MAKPLPESPPVVPTWTFLTNHGHVLVCLLQQSDIRIAEIARRVGIGERAVQAIINDLVVAGYVTRERQGRRNLYTVDVDLPLRHPVEATHRIGDVLAALRQSPRPRRGSLART